MRDVCLVVCEWGGGSEGCRVVGAFISIYLLRVAMSCADLAGGSLRQTSAGKHCADNGLC